MKKLLSIILAVVMLSMLTMTALAAFERPTSLEAPIISNPELYINEAGNPVIAFTMTTPDSVKAILASIETEGSDDWIDIELQYVGSDGEWESTGILGNREPRDGVFEFYPGKDAEDVETVPFQVRYKYKGDGRTLFYSEWSNSIERPAINGSEWAVDELEKADALGLIPDILQGADLTADITRAEFAAVSVKVYEALSGTPALPAVANPFTDTADPEILKAYNIGAVNGTSATTYSPNDLLNREQAAAMLTRVFKRVTLPGWTLATDASFKLDYTKPALFADDADISDWAKESVYFMAANNIINGVGNNKFAPKNTTTAQQAQGYANATREQALIIAMRMVENLK